MAEKQNPSRINDLGFIIEVISTLLRRKNYMWSIITCPKPEHDTCVAPSISRAKS